MNTLTGRLLTPEIAKEYITAGNAIVSIKNIKTGNHFTFKIKKGKDTPKYGFPSPSFVSVLTGPDIHNWNHWTYLGTIIKNDIKTFKHGKKSKIGTKAMSFIVFNWLSSWMNQKNELPKTVELWHEGTCGKCGRKLTVPESVERGLGPECAGIINARTKSQYKG